VWAGQVNPLEERYRLFLFINGTTGVLRIPENNRWGNQRLVVEVTGDDVTVKGPDLHGRYDAATDRLVLTVFRDQAVAFTRHNARDALGFYPRVPWPASYAYRRPETLHDGWRTTSLGEAGLNEKIVGALMQSVLDADSADPKTVPIHSILIARHGRLAVEEYFYGFDRDRPHDSRSAGKTFAPLLAGIARDHDVAIAPDATIAELLPQYQPFANDDDRKAKLTLEHIMSMRSGLARDDNDPESPGGEDRMQGQRQQPDWYKYTVDLPMLKQPGGSDAVYCSADLNLVGGIAGTRAHPWNVDLFSRYIATPLGFTTYHLNLMPTGDAYMGGGVYLRPRDALKLGQLYLDGGLWNGVRIVSKEWVRRSTTAYGTFARSVVEGDVNHQYGWGWHIHHYTIDGRTYREYAAEGNGGQFVMVFPDLDLVVGVNAGKYGSSDWYRWGLQAVVNYLVPAAVIAESSRTRRDRPR